MSSASVKVKADREYEVLIGKSNLSELLPQIGQAVQRIAVIYPADLTQLAKRLFTLLDNSKYEILKIEVSNAESSKTYQSAIACWDQLGEKNFTRSDLIIGFGGGATTDLAGFVAATWLRGIDSILVPTSLLAMVDAAVGGKTGINTLAGKNLVGVFSSPKAVICDLDFLSSLPKPDLAAGLAEVIKCGFIWDKSILEIFENDFDIEQEIDYSLLQVLIEKAVNTKARVVGEDFKESSNSKLGREVLNYGHTLGHAIEKLENFTWRHGDAVAVGMIFAAELAHAAGLLPAPQVAKHHELISKLKLPTKYHGRSLEEVLSAMAIDKKTRGSTLRFVVLDDLASPTRLEAPNEEVLQQAWQKVSN
jgi:3-dehydroquinate synthase